MRDLSELKALLARVDELRDQGASHSKIRSEIEEKFGLTLTENQLLSLLRAVSR